MFLLFIEGALTSCGANHWLCANHQDCIPRNKRCDAQSDCHDGSDEYNCSKLLRLYDMDIFLV